jgi:hypothetical protein
MRVEDPVSSRGGLKLGSPFYPAGIERGILNQNLYFEMASSCFTVR